MQRSRRSRLDDDRQHQLQELPGWTWDARADRWEEGFSRLLNYVERHGDSLVPKSYTVHGYPLGQWVHDQRNFHSRGTLHADRERRLQDLTGWTWDTYANKWEEGFSRLLDYVECNGDARVPDSYTVDGYGLGAWVGRQRNHHDRGTLDAERQQRLQGLSGWTWDPFADMWEEGFAPLLDYVERHGHARVPQSYIVDGYALGRWVMTQRNRHAKGTLDADRERRLQDLPGWTWKARSVT